MPSSFFDQRDRPVIVEMGWEPDRAAAGDRHCFQGALDEAKAVHSSGKKLVDCADLIIDNLFRLETVC